MNRLIFGDCRKAGVSGVAHLVLTDPPYGQTQNKWDTAVPFAHFWEVVWNAAVDDRSPCVSTAVNPFASMLLMSGKQWYRHEWVWTKRVSGHLTANIRPMVAHELVMVFSRSRPRYVPIRLIGGTRPRPAQYIDKKSTNYGRQRPTTAPPSDGSTYPTSVDLKYRKDPDKLHPTQKPVAMCEYLIRTYTQEGNTVFDPFAGSGTTAIAANEAGRSFVCVEKDPENYQVAKTRIENAGISCEFIE